MEPPLGIDGFTAVLGILVITHHHPFTATEDLSLVGDLDGHPGPRLADGTDLVGAKRVVDGRKRMVLGHTPRFGHLEADAQIPLKQRRGDRCRTAAQHPGLIQPQPLFQLALDKAGDQRDLEQQFEFLLGQLLVDLDAEHGPQPRYRDKYGRAAALDVFNEGVEGFGEGDGGAAKQAAAVDVDPLGDVGQRQVGETAILLAQPDRLHQLLARPRITFDGQHGPFRLAGTAGGIDQAQQGVRRLHRAVGDGLVCFQQIIPLVAGRHGVVGKGDTQQIGRHPRLLTLPVIKLANKDRLGLAVAQHIFDGIDVGGRVDGHAHVLPHLHRQIGDKPLGAVFGKQRHFIAGNQPQMTQSRHHAPRFIGHFTPGEIDIFAVDGLTQIGSIRTLPLPVIEHLERQFFGNT